MIHKVVVPAAGLGTRLLPATKEQPKEMLPIFVKTTKGKLVLKPALQVIFEGLYDFGFREFCFIVGRGKRAIEDHFTPDDNFLSYLRNRDDDEHASELEKYYKKIVNSTIIFVNQPKPSGFGDAVLRAESFIGDEPFLVHAGDDLILSKDKGYLKRLTETFEKIDSDAVLLVEDVDDPRKYGVIVGEEIEDRLYKVERIVEKPKIPPSNLAVIAIYIFSSRIFDSLRDTDLDERNELQLTDAIQRLVSEDYPVYAMELKRGEKRVEIGTPNTYWKAMKTTFMYQTP